MMVKPPLKKLESQVDSKYTLVTLTAKRAREILDEDRQQNASDARKPVSIALHEVAKGKITYKRVKENLK